MILTKLIEFSKEKLAMKLILIQFFLVNQDGKEGHSKLNY